MGQGFSLTTLSAGSAGIDVPELSDLAYEKSLGTARFMKSIRARHHDGLVVVKVVMKPYPSMKLDQYVREILRERAALVDVPNALGYERILETSSNGYLVRQYLYSSLYDRMSTRPFLEDIEKKWLAFQLLCGLRDCHARNVYHGDIKTENTLVTSWNWLYLADFSSSFKPAYLPEDNPADFSYYFDTSGRRTCYLAPERFLIAGERAPSLGKVTWAMDIFSAGCVIAELFVEAPTFSLSQLFKYRKGEYDPVHAHLSKIEDPEVRELVTHMIQVEPESRYSADEYLNFWRRKAFPEYFYSFLHQYMGLITDPSSGRAPVTAEEENLGEGDDRIDRIYYDFDKISFFLGYENEKMRDTVGSVDALFGNDIIPVQVDIPNNQHQVATTGRKPADDGSLIFLTLVVSSLRSTARATARVRACDILLAFAERIPDEAKLDRVLPYVVTLLNDKADLVKIAAIRTLTQLMSLVNAASPVNAYVFPEYILPRLKQFIPSKSSKPHTIVRATYASCLATLAITSSRFLDMVQAFRADGSLPTADPEAEDGVTTESTYQTLYDVARNDLVDHFETHTKALLTDEDSSVRRAFLGSVSSLCVFFGSSKANDVILSHLNTYLNDKDWMLKCAFFETIVGVATFVGSTSLEEFILPLMVQAMTDPEEFVVEKVLRSIASMAELGLFSRPRTWELIGIVIRFTMHPNIWIREAAASFLSAATKYLSPADNRCIITPLIHPYLKTAPLNFEETTLLSSLKKPLPRAVFEMAMSWAVKVEKGVFWKSAQNQHTFTLGLSHESIPRSSKGPSNFAMSKIPKNDEDEQWLTRLRNLGMASDDEWKLVALGEYIWRTAPLKQREGASANASDLNSIINLKQLAITPQTIFFDEVRYPLEDVSSPNETASNGNSKAPHTISDALLDASMTIDDPLSRRKKSHYNSRKARENGQAQVSPATPSDLQRPSQNGPSPPSSVADSPVGSQGSTSRATSAEGRKVLKLPHRQTNGSVDAEDTSPNRSTLGVGTPAVKADHLRHKASAVSLLNKKDRSKAFAETSTSSENAQGKVEGPFLRGSRAQSPLGAEDQKSNQMPPIRFRGAHTYEGNDPNVLRLLDSLYLENYPTDLMEFGPIVPQISRRQRIKKGSGEQTDLSWRPDGTLVAMFGEHTAAINRVVVAPDHCFFVTASDDGTAKVWDTGRLERNVAHRSRQTYKHAAGAKIKALCFIESTHCFVTAATDGTVHVVKVDYAHGAGASKYGKLRQLKEHHLDTGEHAVWLEHFRGETHSILIVATNKSRIQALDLRTMSVLYTLENPIHHGTPTCFCVDKRHAWLLVGTTHGVLDLWDLRFQVRLKAWGLPGATPITRLSTYPLKGRGKLVCVAGGCAQGEITIWDIEKSQCKEVFRPGGAKDSRSTYEPWKVDEERPEEMLGRFATSLEPAASGNVDRGARAFITGLDALEDGRESKYGFIISGGSDRKIRFWDLNRIETSTIISGLEADEPKPKYVSIQALPSLLINTEKIPQPGPTAPNAGSDTRPSSNTSAKRSGGRSSRSTVISLQQQLLLKSHLDSILDIALLESPYGMTISVDRSGIIYVFQ
ncbi:MAG: hypothetical protein M4579_006272 [Chaenotheca gracillima]|nr:MAG: hypothetical protein M4579_006272 [Chaenotheca gracillima]